MVSADFCAFSTASQQRLSLSEQTIPFPPFTCHIYPARLRVVIGLRLTWQSFPHAERFPDMRSRPLRFRYYALLSSCHSAEFNLPKQNFTFNGNDICGRSPQIFSFCIVSTIFRPRIFPMEYRMIPASSTATAAAAIHVLPQGSRNSVRIRRSRIR